MMTPGELALFAFTACNTLRVVAYLPQIVRIANDKGGADAISFTTWGLFGLSHLSTVLYAVVTIEDWKLALIFTANTVACITIVALTLYKRLRFLAVGRTAMRGGLVVVQDHARSVFADNAAGARDERLRPFSKLRSMSRA
jgi:hypothetical protein